PRGSPRGRGARSSSAAWVTGRSSAGTWPPARWRCSLGPMVTGGRPSPASISTATAGWSRGISTAGACAAPHWRERRGRPGDRRAARHALAAGSLPNDVVVAGDTAYVTDSESPVIWRLSAGPGGIGQPEVAIDLSRFGAADPAYLNGIVAHPGGSLLLAASQG